MAQEHFFPGGHHTSITESTRINHRPIGIHENVLTIGDTDFWHDNATRERVMHKLISAWVTAGWAEEARTLLLEEVARAAAPEPFADNVSQQHTNCDVVPATSGTAWNRCAVHGLFPIWHATCPGPDTNGDNAA